MLGIVSTHEYLYGLPVPRTASPHEWARWAEGYRDNATDVSNDTRNILTLCIYRAKKYPEDFAHALRQRIAHPTMFLCKGLVFPEKSITEVLGEVTGRWSDETPPHDGPWFSLRDGSPEGEYTSRRQPLRPTNRKGFVYARWACRAPEFQAWWDASCKISISGLHIVARSDGTRLLTAEYSDIIGSVWVAADDRPSEVIP
jgi:hypothetical protein